MSPALKAVMTIIVWVLFIKGLIAAVVGCVTVGMAIMRGDAPAMGYVAVSIVGVVALISASVAAKLRKMVE
jgi:hypothetical protein